MGGGGGCRGAGPAPAAVLIACVMHMTHDTCVTRAAATEDSGGRVRPPCLAARRVCKGSAAHTRRGASAHAHRSHALWLASRMRCPACPPFPVRTPVCTSNKLLRSVKKRGLAQPVTTCRGGAARPGGRVAGDSAGGAAGGAIAQQPGLAGWFLPLCSPRQST